MMTDSINAVTHPPMEGERKWKAVYTIVDKGQEKRAFWLRIGTAFINRDLSMTVKLDAAPLNGSLHIRDYDPPGRTGDDRPSPPRRDEAMPSFGDGGMR